jgi:hypothetical protein
VARDGLPVALIDWDTAGPTGRLDKIAATGWWNAQLVDDDVAERNALPPAAARARQLRWFLDGYRLPAADPAPLWALAWRARSAAWMIRHRALLETAIT